MEETTLLVDEQNLHGLEDLGELSGGDIGVNVEKLTVLGLSKRGEDGERTGSDAGLNGVLVDLDDVADVLVSLLVSVLGGEDTSRNRSGTRAEGLEGGDELEVLLKEDSL